MVGHFLNLEFVKCFIEGRGETEKMPLTLLHSESDRTFKSIHVPNTNEMHFSRVWVEMIAWAMDFL